MGGSRGLPAGISVQEYSCTDIHASMWRIESREVARARRALERYRDSKERDR